VKPDPLSNTVHEVVTEVAAHDEKGRKRGTAEMKDKTNGINAQGRGRDQGIENDTNEVRVRIRVHPDTDVTLVHVPAREIRGRSESGGIRDHHH